MSCRRRATNADPVCRPDELRRVVAGVAGGILLILVPPLAILPSCVIADATAAEPPQPTRWIGSWDEASWTYCRLRDIEVGRTRQRPP